MNFSRIPLKNTQKNKEEENTFNIVRPGQRNKPQGNKGTNPFLIKNNPNISKKNEEEIQNQNLNINQTNLPNEPSKRIKDEKNSHCKITSLKITNLNFFEELEKNGEAIDLVLPMEDDVSFLCTNKKNEIITEYSFNQNINDFEAVFSFKTQGKIINMKLSRTEKGQVFILNQNGLLNLYNLNKVNEFNEPLLEFSMRDVTCFCPLSFQKNTLVISDLDNNLKIIQYTPYDIKLLYENNSKKFGEFSEMESFEDDNILATFSCFYNKKDICVKKSFTMFNLENLKDIYYKEYNGDYEEQLVKLNENLLGIRENDQIIFYTLFKGIFKNIVYYKVSSKLIDAKSINNNISCILSNDGMYVFNNSEQDIIEKKEIHEDNLKLKEFCILNDTNFLLINSNGEVFSTHY